jgi:hypothetical protein
MKSVVINICSASKIYDKTRIDDLEEKRLVPNMMLRRRLTRNAKVMLYLSDKCGFMNGKVVYGSCFGEIEETAKIADAVAFRTTLSPTVFQNSVYNTASSYFSLINSDTDEILTISNGMKTSLDALKIAALQALIHNEKILCVAVECLNIKNIEQINRCANFLEAGAGVVLEITSDEKDAHEIESIKFEGIIDSLQVLMNVVNMYENGITKIRIEL